MPHRGIERPRRCGVVFTLLWHGADDTAARWCRPMPLEVAAWVRGELHTWRRSRHDQFPRAFRDDVAAVLLATLGNDERAENPLRVVRQQLVLNKLFKALLRAHMGGAVATSRRRCCALPGCGAVEARYLHFKRCAGCRAVVYCCLEHHAEGWPAHRRACKAARKAQAEEAAGLSGA